MLTNYLKIAWRNLFKNKGYSLINISGLAIGMTCCILILLYVQDDLSFDSFHSKRSQIYRLNKIVTPQTGGTEFHAITSGLMGPTMVTDFPEVENCVRVLPWFSDVLMTYEETTLKISDVVFADSNFFDVFDFRLVRGDPATALVEPQSMVLTKETAHKFFGDANPIGQTILGLNNHIYKITGVMENAPRNSHLRINALISWTSTIPGTGALNWAWLNRWITQVNFTYLVLTPGADVAALEQKLSGFMQKYMPQKAQQYQLYLQPFSEIYLKSANILFSDRIRVGNITYVYMFSAIAILILLIACINFMNLSTARASKRAKEVGVRKVMGALRQQLAKQFLGESVILAFLALILVVTAVEIILPYFNSFTNKELRFDLTSQPLMAISLLSFTFIIGVGSGIYPALLLSAFRPVQVLKGVLKSGVKGAMARKILVTAQFTISIALIAGTFIVYKQMRYVQTKSLGFQKEQVVHLNIGNTDISDQFQAFKNEILQHPNIIYAAGSNSIPGTGMMSFRALPEGKPESEDWIAYTIRVDDYDFLQTYGMGMAAGRYFSPEFTTDATNGVVINETFAKALGWENPVGKRLDISGELQNGKVIGVIKDFHMGSLHNPVEPMVIHFAPRHERLSLRISGQDIPGTIQFLESKWQKFESRYPFEYRFVDEIFDEFYRSEERLMQTFGLFSILAIFVACLGLLGLASYTSEQRTKEFGVRKVLGASVTNIVMLLWKEFGKLICFAFLIATPVAFFVMNKWLQDFSYRTEIGVWVFGFAGILALAVGLFTISYQAIKAALANPVEALKYE